MSEARQEALSEPLAPGQPLVFGCHECRTTWRPGAADNPGTLDRVQLTGRVRLKSPLPATSGPRMTASRYEYRCADCGYHGWSRHIELATRADAEGVLPHARDLAGRMRCKARRGRSPSPVPAEAP